MSDAYQITAANEKVAPIPPALSGATDTASLIRLALENQAGMETLERLLALRNHEEARIAQQEFDRRFALMQSEFKPVKRTKAAKNGEKTMYRYAPLEELQAVNGDIIAKHGFSYSWEELGLEDGSRRYTLVISGWGHTKKVPFDIPKMTGSSMMNAAQAAASMSTYGRRYSFVLGFGMSIEDEDDDGQAFTFEQGVKYAEFIRDIKASATMEELQQTYVNAVKALKGDNDGLRVIIAAKEDRKKELSK